MATKTSTKKAPKRTPKVALTGALLAWETRRATGDPSASAKKAWATRRGMAKKSSPKKATKAQPKAKRQVRKAS